MNRPQSDVLILGGGIVGAATAYYLSRLGINSTIVEMDRVGGHASGYAFGGLHPRLHIDASPEMHQFVGLSFQQHIELDEQITHESSFASTWRSRSSIELFFTELEIQARKRELQNEDHGLEFLNLDTIRQDEPLISKRVSGGLLNPNSAEVDALALVETLTELSKAKVILGEVTSLVFNRNQVIGVKLADSQEVQADIIVVALGPWTNNVFKWLGFSFTPIKPLKGQILRIEVPGSKLKHSYSVASNYMSTKDDGLVWVGTTEESQGFDENPTTAGRNEILKHFNTMLVSPTWKVIKQTACIRPMSVDNNIILGAPKRHDNVIFATGGGRKGILYGPRMGFEVANAIDQGFMSENWQCFTPDRFA